MNDNSKCVKIFIKKYKYEFIALSVDILLIIASFIYFNNQKAAFILSFIVVLLSTFMIIYLKTKDKDFYFMPFNKPGQDKDWVGRGTLKFVHNESCYEITDSDVGFIFPKTSVWDDYKYEFDFKVVNKCIAWIVRAVNLSNYVMFQCGFNGINPHIRLNGEWIVMHHGDSDVKMTFERDLSRDTWYKATITCEKRSMRIKIYDYSSKKIIFDRHWRMPDSLSVKFPKRKIANESSATDNDYVIMNQNIDFDFGSVGIRNWGDERGFMKNIYIEKL